jgi:hypothetical protein
MTPVAAVLRGAGAVRRAWTVWLLVWVLTLAFALFLVLPAAALLYGRLGHSLYAGRMLGNFDIQWLAEFRHETGNWPLLAAKPAVALASGGYLLLMTFLYGGALAVFASTDSFWGGCGRYFWRMLRLFLVSLACYAMVYLVYAELGKAGYSLWGRGMAERPVVLFGWARASIALLLFLFVNMVFDYAKIRLVVEDSRRAIAAAGDSFLFAARHPGATIGTYALISILAAALAAIYWVLAGVLPTTALAWLALVLVVQQSFIAARIGIKLLYLSGQMEIYQALKAPPHMAAPGPAPAAPADPSAAI